MSENFYLNYRFNLDYHNLFRKLS